MKALILSDLHISSEYFHKEFGRNKYKRILKNNIKDDYDIVLISGDIFEHYIMNTNINPFEFLNDIFEGKEVIFCLGNHEFAYENFNNVLHYWNDKQHLYNGKNIHCLDICNSYILNKINFVGNVFWYDFSLNKNPLLMQGEIIDGWLDATIHDFDPIKENKINQQKIINELKNNKNHKNILITHMVPYWSLNTFSIEDENSIYNAYSGNYDFLKDIKGYGIEYVLCGHTHRRECKEIYGIKCINIGNDYLFNTNKIQYLIINI